MATDDEVTTRLRESFFSSSPEEQRAFTAGIDGDDYTREEFVDLAAIVYMHALRFGTPASEQDCTLDDGEDE